MHLAPRALQFLISTLIAALFARTFLLQGIEIVSSSMEPTLLVGDHLVVNKLLPQLQAVPLLPTREIRRGDVVVFRLPHDPRRLYVKRCVGLPGERVAMSDDSVWIDGRRLREPYREASGPEPAKSPTSRFTVPSEHYFMLGDKRQASLDSRDWGPVSGAGVVGLATRIYWSRPQALAPQGPGAAGRGPIRWRRLLQLIE